MTRLTKGLHVLYLTEDAGDKDVPRLEAFGGVYNRLNVIDLYIGSNKVFTAASALVMHCQLTRLGINLPTNKGFFQSFVLRRPAP